MSSGLEVLGGYKTDIRDATAELFAEAPKLLDVDLSADGIEALEQLEAYARRPGKSIRGSLAALTYDVAANTEHAVEGAKLGAVLELMQNYLLIIDDVMDRSPLRRGEPSLHMLYQEAGHDAHEASMLAINVGLIAQHLGSLSLQQLDAPAEARLEVMGLMQRNMTITGFGQFDDVAHANLSRSTSVDVIDTYRKKTSYYTFVNPLQLGFALAGRADAATLRDCEAYGVPMGVAYQLHDDYLGIWGDVAGQGKSNLDDIRDGKRTAYVGHVLAYGDEAAKTKLLQILGNTEADEADLSVVRTIFEETGASAAVLAAEQAAIREAEEALRAPTFQDPKFSGVLGELIHYVTTRKS